MTHFSAQRRPAARGGAVAQAYSPRPLTEGERWTAETLSALRQRRYRPQAWGRFVYSSWQRSTAARERQPRLSAQGRRWGAAGAVCWVGTCVAVGRGSRLRPARGLLWWAAVWQMLDWHLGMAEGGDGRPRERLSGADALTLSRFWLVPVVDGTRDSPAGLPAVILLGGLTDWADGALARRVGRTRLGRDLDTTARAAGRLPAVGAWSLILRYATGVLLAVAAVFGRARRPAIRARPWGAALRVAGLALSAAGLRRTGTSVLVVGCVVPPRSTASHLSRA